MLFDRLNIFSIKFNAMKSFKQFPGRRNLPLKEGNFLRLAVASYEMKFLFKHDTHIRSLYAINSKAVYKVLWRKHHVSKVGINIAHFFQNVYMRNLENAINHTVGAINFSFCAIILCERTIFSHLFLSYTYSPSRTCVVQSILS